MVKKVRISSLHEQRGPTRKPQFRRDNNSGGRGVGRSICLTFYICLIENKGILVCIASQTYFSGHLALSYP